MILEEIPIIVWPVRVHIMYVHKYYNGCMLTRTIISCHARSERNLNVCDSHVHVYTEPNERTDVNKLQSALPGRRCYTSRPDKLMVKVSRFLFKSS